MQKSFISIVLMFVSFEAFCQDFSQYFAPEELIVNALDLRFRAAPDLNSEVISLLDEGEFLDFISFVKDSEPNFFYYETLSYTWLKVRRQNTGVVGFVYGQYVHSANTALKYGQDCERIPLLNWYGLNVEKEIPYLEEVNPVVKADKWAPTIMDTTEPYFYLGTKDKYETGSLHGTIFHNERLFLIKDGDKEALKDSLENIISFEVCQDFDIIDNKPVNIRERFYLKVETTEGIEILFQELTNQFNHRGNLGFWIHFVGDINRDGLPELIFSPINENGRRVLWYLSDGKKITLQSINYFGPSE